MRENQVAERKNRAAPDTKTKNPLTEAVASGRGLLAAAVAIAGGTEAYASVIRFDNTAHGEAGHFHWAIPGPAMTSLDLALPPSEQGGWTPMIPTAVHQSVFNGYSKIVGDGDTSLQVGLPANYPENYFAVGVDAGQLIPTSGTSWQQYPAYVFYPGWGPETLLPEGTPTYLGVRFDLGSGWQYGWIGAVRTGLELEAFAWGYETVPGVPIAAGAEIPGPGTLALLAFGAVTGAMGRGRKRSARTTNN